LLTVVTALTLSTYTDNGGDRAELAEASRLLLA
jgi:hypothetical protein